MTLAGLFSIGFVMGLTGAMAPGPLLSIAVSESARRGGFVGPLLVLGHGILEFVLLVLIVAGLGKLLTNPTVFTVMALAGGAVLVIMGVGTMKGLKNYRLEGVSPSSRRLHPIWAGIVVSVSNPYWFIWWLTVGTGYVVFARTLGLRGVLVFFLGHILSDLAWYSFVSYAIHFGGRLIRLPVIKGILFVCSLFLIAFGLFFIIRGFQSLG